MKDKYLVNDSFPFVLDIKQPYAHVAADGHVKAEIHYIAL